jgi:hypothetical protein
VQFIRAELARVSTSDRRRIAEAFILAALGSIPWVGGFIGAAATYMAELHETKGDTLHGQWLEEHARKIAMLVRSLQDIERHFESLDGQVDARIQSDGYLALVRRAFRVWDRADSDEKRDAGGTVIRAGHRQLPLAEILRLIAHWPRIPVSHVKDPVLRGRIEARDDVAHRKPFAAERRVRPGLRYHGVGSRLHLLDDPVTCFLSSARSGNARAEVELSLRVPHRAVAVELARYGFILAATCGGNQSDS